MHKFAPLKLVGDYVRRNPQLGRVALRAIPNWQSQVDVADVGPMRIRLREHRTYWLRDPLTHDGFMLGALKHLIQPGDVVYDIGANIGLYTRFLLKQTAASKIVAFEPVESNLGLFRQNIALSSERDRVILQALALADSDGEEELQIDDVHSQSGRLDRLAPGEAANGRKQYGLPPVTTKVQTRKLDTLVADGVIPPPNVVKIDVEGAEELVIQGGLRTLVDHQPRIVLEMHESENNRLIHRCFGLLTAAGYRCFGYLQKEGEPHATYRELRFEDVRDLPSIYCLHHLAAAVDASCLAQPLPLLARSA